MEKIRCLYQEPFYYLIEYTNCVGKDIAIEQYPDGKLRYSCGKIKRMTHVKRYEFVHDASTKKGSSGSPIFLEGTERVIGIHKFGVEIETGNRIKTENYGDFIWPIYDYFENFSENQKKFETINKIEETNITGNDNLGSSIKNEGEILKSKESKCCLIF